MSENKDGASLPLDVRRVLFEYKALSEYELSLTKDDLVVIETQVDENPGEYWTRGRLALTQTRGLAPVSYLSSPLRGVKNEVEAVCLNLALTRGVGGLSGKFGQTFDQKTNEYYYEYYEDDSDNQFSIDQTSLDGAGLGVSRIDDDFFSDDSFTDTEDEEERSTSRASKQIEAKEPTSVSFEEIKIAKVIADHRCNTGAFQLSVKKGDFVTVFPEEDNDATKNSEFLMVAERKHPFDLGYLPKNKLASVPELQKQPWYLGCIGSPLSDYLLKGPGVEDLTFLVRDSEGPQKGYVICVRSKNQIKYKKLPLSGKGFRLIPEHKFESLVELVDFHLTCSTPSYRLGVPFNKYAECWKEHLPARENKIISKENPLLNRLEDELRTKQTWTKLNTGIRPDFTEKLNSKLTLSQMVQLQLDSLSTKVFKVNEAKNVGLNNPKTKEVPGSLLPRSQNSLHNFENFRNDSNCSSKPSIEKVTDKNVDHIGQLQTQLQSRFSNLGLQEGPNANQISQINWPQSNNTNNNAVLIYPPTAPQIPPKSAARQMNRLNQSSNAQVTNQERKPAVAPKTGSLAGSNWQRSTGFTPTYPNLQATQNSDRNVKPSVSEIRGSASSTVKYPNLQKLSSSNNSSDGFNTTPFSNEPKKKDKTSKNKSITLNIKKRYEQLFEDSKQTKAQKIQAKDLKANIKEEWQIDSSNITLNDLIGSGFYGEVYKGEWKGIHGKVAVKTFKNAKMSINDFYIEANSMMRLRHPNLVKLYGVCAKQNSSFLVMEYHQSGSILDYIKSGNVLLKMDYERIGYEVASGMEYLGKSGFIHRDLSARNVLVDNDLHAKIADFGLARSVKDLKEETKDDLKMPWKWTAPEAFENPPKWSTASDVWSFGIFLWEIYSNGEQPYEDVTSRPILMIYLNSGRLLQRPEKCPPSLYQNIMTKCWKLNEKQRLSFQEIKDLFQAMTSSAVPF